MIEQLIDTQGGKTEELQTWRQEAEGVPPTTSVVMFQGRNDLELVGAGPKT